MSGTTVADYLGYFERLGYTPSVLEKSTGAERKVINKEVAIEHRDSIQAEQASRQRLADEKEKRKNVKPAPVESKPLEAKQPSAPIHSQ